MARLAAGFAFAAVVGFVALAAGVVHGQSIVQLPQTTCQFPPPPRHQPTPVKIFCSQDTSLNLAVTDDASGVVLADNNPLDPLQQWIPDYLSVGKLTDVDGNAPFALVNLAKGVVLVNVPGPVNPWDFVPVQVVPFDSCVTKASTLWTMVGISGSSFSEIMPFTNSNQVLDADGSGLPQQFPAGTRVGLFRKQFPEAPNAMWQMASLGL